MHSLEANAAEVIGIGPRANDLLALTGDRLPQIPGDLLLLGGLPAISLDRGPDSRALDVHSPDLLQ